MLKMKRIVSFLAGFLVVGAISTAQADLIAYDMVGSSSQNLTSYVNNAPIFSSAGDGFGKYQRGVSSSIPYGVLDDSLSYSSDSLGIIKESNTDEFFGVTDTENNDNSGIVTAIWTFDISNAEDLSLSIDMGAMGDFEASNDYFSWTYSIDGGATTTAFESTINEDASQDYTLSDGDTFTLDDYMMVGNIVLTNDLQTLTTAILGTGSTLTLTLTAETNGGEEAFAFQNVEINGTSAVPVPAAVWLLGSGLLGLIGIRRRDA
jgi:hypothetical protein